jgi:hypothetical protein
MRPGLITHQAAVEAELLAIAAALCVCLHAANPSHAAAAWQ